MAEAWRAGKLEQLEVLAIYAAVLAAPINDPGFQREHGTAAVSLLKQWQEQYRATLKEGV